MKTLQTHTASRLAAAPPFAAAPMLALVAATLFLSGCSSLSESMQGDKVDYKTSGKGTSLDVPPDLTQLSRETRYVVPGTAVTASGYQVGQTTQSVPTAATAVVGGQIKTADGRGIRNVLVTITHPNGQTQAARSGSFGYYRFAEIPVGETYVISVTAKKYIFSQPTQIRTVQEDVQDIDFIAL